MTSKTGILAAALMVLAGPALADNGASGSPGFAAGITHPLSGIDHILTMVAVGLWAAQQGGRALWLVPASFVGVMVLGGALGFSSVGLPGVETAIAMSVVALGVLVAARVRLPLAAGTALVGLFALVHGHAHGTELPAGALAAGYATGFALATTGLHALGASLGLALSSRAGVQVVRASGGACALVGMVLLAG